jgi:glutamate racemase
MKKQPIGVFDSGYGGLTVLKEMTSILPEYDYLYLGDNARAPYGTKEFDLVYRYTWEAVKWLFEQGCPLVILACNTASAKALRSIQQKELPAYDKEKRVLGVIRPTSEVIGQYSKTGHVGVLGTPGTVDSGSYLLEIGKFFPELDVKQQACPEWVSLVESNLYATEKADYWVEKYLKEILEQDEHIDTLLLACTHYPLLIDKIKQHLPNGIKAVAQGKLVADSLRNYLNRHPEIDAILSRGGEVEFYTTGEKEDFNAHASVMYGKIVESRGISLENEPKT